MKSMDYMKAYLAAKVSEMEEQNVQRQRVPRWSLERELEEALKVDYHNALCELLENGEVIAGRTLNERYIRSGKGGRK